VNYRVIWSLRATEELQRLYDSALDQEGVLNAVTRIGLELAAQPETAGESRDQDARILFKPPLIVWYELHERMKDVVIYEVRPSRR